MGKRILRDARGVYWMEGANAHSWHAYCPDVWGDGTISIHVQGNSARITTSERLLLVPRDGLEHRVHRALLRAKSAEVRR